MPRKGELTDKDMSVIRETDQTKLQRDKKFGVLKDYSLEHRVEIDWDLNEEAVRDQMFRLIVDDYEVILDLEELLRYTRWM
jgi:hypothetical protein